MTWLCAGVLLALLLAGSEDPFAFARERMVRDQIEARGVHEVRLLQVLRAIPRHLFVPAVMAREAYDDRPLPIGHGATISQPLVVAHMTELLKPEKKHRVLEIGTGSGYQAAVLSALVEEVYSIEIVPELAREAAWRLASLGYRNVKVRHGDGYQGWPEKAPFDGIILTAAPAEVPRALLDQLAGGGRLVAPVGAHFYDQYLILMEKDKHGKIRESQVGAVAFVPMVHEK